jgi:hypothetical protein
MLLSYVAARESDLGSLLCVENGGHGLESHKLTKSAVGRRLSFFAKLGVSKK